MKLSTKIVAVAFVVAIALTVTTVASAAIDNNLTIGSTGAEVTALQTTLVADGYLTMPAGVNMGYFGALTKAAVVKYQIANSISGTGFVGPLTRAALNAGGTAASVALCPNGDTIASNCSLAPNAQAVPLCPNGMTLASNCATAPASGTTVSANGTDGTLTAGLSSYVSSGIQLKKGDTKDILAVNLKASVGPVTLTRVAVHFNTRPWLILSQITLHDSTGKVLVTKALNSAADATEITVGSDYLVDFGNVNYTVNPGNNVDLVVGATVLSATDKIPTAGLTLVTAFDPIRTINGIGWTDSNTTAGYNDFPTYTASAAGMNSVTLTSTGSVADIYTRISPNTPVARQVAVSTTQTTYGVVLGTFSIKSANNASTLNTLTVSIASTTSNTSISSAFSNVRLFNGSTSYGGVLAANGTVVFSNLNIPLAQDAWQDLTVQADVAANVTASGLTVALTASTASGNPVVTDSNYNTATAESITATSNAIVLTTNAVTVSSASLTLGSAIVQSQSTVGYNVAGSLTITNTSNNDLYVSGTSTVLVTQTATVNGTASTSAVTNGFISLNTISNVSPSTYSGDSTNPAAYIIPAGLSRTFALTGVIRGTTGQTSTLKITQVNYGITAALNVNNALPITTGLDNLSVTASF